MTDLVYLITPFEDHRITTVTYRGRPAWIARQLGEAIGYAQQGKRFATRITGAWSDEFIEGRDYLVLAGTELELFKSLLELGTDPVPSRAPSLLLLFESGLHLALAKTSKPVGKRLRRFLVDEVLPQLVRDGAYSPDRAVRDGELVPKDVEARLQREQRLARKLGLDDRKFRAGSLRRTVGTLHALGYVDDEVFASYEVAASEIALEQDLSVLKPGAPDDWLSPTRIGKQFGVSAQKVGRVISRLGLRGNRPGLARAVVNKARGHDRTVITYLYSPAAVSQIEAALQG
jgi:prophage antirepressor-like protein